MDQTKDYNQAFQEITYPYFSREYQIKRSFDGKRHHYQQVVDWPAKCIILDSSNQRLCVPDAVDLKFASELAIPPNASRIIANPYILTPVEGYEIIDDTNITLPNAQTAFLEDEETEIDLQIFNYIKSNLQEEQAILIYCSDLNQMENLKIKLELIARVCCLLPQLHDTQFDYNTLFSNTSDRRAQIPIYLALEPGYIDCDHITTIIHCPTKEVIKPLEKLAVSIETVSLSHTELLIREIPRSRHLGTKIVYAFPKQVFVQLPAKPILQPVKLPNLEEKVQYLAIVLAILQTPGRLLMKHQNLQLKVRSSPYWIKSGDAFSWINIIVLLAQKIERHLENMGEDVICTDDVRKWCQQNAINLLKGLLVIQKVEEYAEKLNARDLKLTQSLMEMPSLVKQKSSFSERVDEKTLEVTLKDHFPHISREAPKVYKYKDQELKLSKDCMLSLIGHYLADALLLGLKDSEIQFMNNYQSRKASFNQKEFVIANVGNAIMNELWRNEGLEMIRFEEENQCNIEPNMELNLIVVYSDHKVEMAGLEKLIEQIRNNLMNAVKEIQFHGNTVFHMSSGGLMIDWSKQEESRGFHMHNLPLSIKEQDIRDWFEDFSEITYIKLTYTPKECKAQVLVKDKEDLPYIIQEFDQLEYEDRVISVIPDQRIGVFKPQKLFEKFCVKLIWFALHSKGTAEVEFNHQDGMKNAIAILDGQRLENRQLKIEQLSELSIRIKNIDCKVTAYQIRQICGGKEAVKSVKMESKPILEQKGDLSHKIQQVVREKCQNHRGVEILSIQRKSTGKRTAVVSVPTEKDLQQVIDSLNNSDFPFFSSILKLYCRPIYREEVEITAILKPILTQELQFTGLSFKLQLEEHVTETDTVYRGILICHNLAIFNKLCQIISNIKAGFEVDVGDGKQILASQFGQQKLKQITQKFSNIRFFNSNQGLRLYATKEQFDLIMAEIKAFLNDSSKYKILMPPRAMKQLIGVDGQGLELFKQQFDLQDISYNSITKELTLTGSVGSLERASQAIQLQISTLSGQDANQGAQGCGICFDSLSNAYLLQNCGHKFCLECIMFQLTNSLQDINSLPIRCPECNKPLIMEDITTLLGEQNLEKLIMLSINKYVSENLATLTFCITKDCPNILRIQNTIAFCSICRKEYCMSCKALKHPGLTCEENRIGDFVLLQRLMEKEDIRRCPNCQSLAQHVSGCFRVQCSACHKHICWKKLKEKPCMQYFNTSSECYAHLDKIHGGYF